MSMLSVVYAERRILAHHAECRYAKRYYAECRYAECRGGPVITLIFTGKGGTIDIYYFPLCSRLGIEPKFFLILSCFLPLYH
jgi:hypothetical protein